MVKFGDVVRNSNLVEHDPEAAGIDKIVGLDDLDPGNLHIRRWDTPGNGTSFSRKFTLGQTLFGKRRAYQHKVAYAEFEGMCSSDILTFEPKDKNALLPGLLPFICQTDAFFRHALGTSAGSLSPRTSWGALSDFEFALPPIEEQKRIAELLWAADDVCSRYAKCCSDLEFAKSSILNALTTEGLTGDASQRRRPGLAPSHWRNLSVGEVTSVCQYGLSIPLNESGQYPILRMMNFRDGHVVANDLKYVDLSDSDFESFRVKKGDILFNRTNSAELVGKVGIFDLDGDYVFASYLVRLRADTSLVLPEYLNFFLNSLVGQRRLLVYATPGVNQSNISAGNLQKVVVPVPTLEEQRQAVQTLEAIERNESGLRQQMARSETILRRLVNGQISDEKHSEAIHVQ